MQMVMPLGDTSRESVNASCLRVLQEKDQAWQDAVDAGEQAKSKALENRCTETLAEAWAVKIRDGWFQDWMAEELPGSGPEERKWRTAILAERGIQSKDETPPTG